MMFEILVRTNESNYTFSSEQNEMFYFDWCRLVIRGGQKRWEIYNNCRDTGDVKHVPILDISNTNRVWTANYIPFEDGDIEKLENSSNL